MANSTNEFTFSSQESVLYKLQRVDEAARGETSLARSLTAYSTNIAQLARATMVHGVIAKVKL